MGKYKSIEDYVKDQAKDKSVIVKELVSIVENAGSGGEKGIKWSQPVFWDDNGPYCFIKAHKEHVNIGFWRGADMKDPKGLLEGTGAKMRHIKIKSTNDIDKKAITDFVKQGLKLNKELGDPSR
jgi:hypothetical protein